ncbi:MAG: 4Fe-4S binding protein [Oscillospiraceae bacterium]|nr:4Fe-4S binding protein [Oscillospiraceae bacterium]
MDRKRTGIQAAAALLQNANFKGFFSGKIYQGPLKSVCVPGLNCYSCPGAVGACPIGSLQSFLGAVRFRFPYYVLGLLLFFGALLGRTVCGFLCPFGLLQELLHRIPFVKKTDRFAADRPLRALKYAVLVLLVIVLPLCAALTPFFCKYVCPAGTAAGLLLALRDGLVRAQLGGIFLWKCAVLALIVLGSLIVWRPFCKYLCPLGAIYGFFNRVSLHRMRLDAAKCIGCGACAEACRMCVDPSRAPNSSECIRCGDCVRACPTAALHIGFGERPKEKEL